MNDGKWWQDGDKMLMSRWSDLSPHLHFPFALLGRHSSTNDLFLSFESLLPPCSPRARSTRCAPFSPCPSGEKRSLSPFRDSQEEKRAREETMSDEEDLDQVRKRGLARRKPSFLERAKRVVEGNGQRRRVLPATPAKVSRRASFMESAPIKTISKLSRRWDIFEISPQRSDWERREMRLAPHVASHLFSSLDKARCHLLVTIQIESSS